MTIIVTVSFVVLLLMTGWRSAPIPKEEIESLRGVLGERVENEVETTDEGYQLESLSKPPRPLIGTRNSKFIWDLEDGNRRDIIWIVLVFLIDSEGNVSKVKVKEAEFDKLIPIAVHEIKKWKFEPAEKDGEKVPCWVRLPIGLKLKECIEYLGHNQSLEVTPFAGAHAAPQL